MSEPEKALQSFLQRWSRRKVAAQERGAEEPDAQTQATDKAQPSPRNEPSPESAATPFDPASLPPIESIGAESDVRAFLAPGVPVELTRAALRRAWTSDPAIRDFIGLAENQWDFTKPEGVPGFGALTLDPELRRTMAALLKEAPADAEKSPDAAVPAAETAQNSGKTGLPDPAATSLPYKSTAGPVEAGSPAFRPGDGDHAAMQSGTPSDRPDGRPAERRHGGALPE
jgi:hypothetical protein